MASQQRTNRIYLPALLLGLLAAVVYIPAYQAGFIWDDDSMLNPLVKAANGLRYIWFSTELPDYFPLTSTTLWLEHQLWGDRAVGYHIVNVLWHVLGGIGLWRVLVLLKIPGAWLAAALFLVHPVNVDSVAWIAERKNTLSFAFFAWSIFYYLKWEERKGEPASKGASAPGAYVLALILFLLALLSKTAVVGLPLVLLLCNAWRNREERNVRGSVFQWHRLLPVLPFFALALAFGLITVWFQYNRAIGEDFIHDNPLPMRIATAGWAVWFYLGKAVWPANLGFVYPGWSRDGNSLVAWAPLLALLGTLAFLYARRRHCSIARAFLFALTYFVLMLLPVLGLLKIYFHRYSPVADHWQYFSLPTITALMAAAVFHKRNAEAGRPIVRVAMATLLLAVCSVLTWRHAGNYQSAEKLWRDTLAKNPRAWLAHNNLGLILDAQGKSEESMTHYRRSLAIQPNQVEAYNNLGSVLLAQGKLDAARAEFEAALKIEPRSAVTHYNIGNLLDNEGKRAEAIASYREALRFNPRYVDAYNNLGCILALEGDIPGAIGHFREALLLDPNDVNSLNNIGSTLVESGNAAEAVPLLEKAVALNARNADAWHNLGNAVFNVGNAPLAAQHYATAIQLDPRMAVARYRLGNALLQMGKDDEAMAQFQAAIEIQPNLAEPRYQLGMLHNARGDAVNAAKHLKEAVRLKPGWIEALNNLAWLLATTRQDEVRDGQEALKLALRVVELPGGDNPGALDTLAAAYAAVGDSQNAIATLEKALASGTLPTELAGQMKERLVLYRSGRPFRE